MMRSKRGAVFVALGAVVSVAAAACSSGSGSGSSSNGAGATTAAAKGGTLTVLTLGPQESWDPQRVYIGADIEYLARMAIRSLVTYSTGDKPELVPDLATDTGKVSDAGKTWQFTLKDGVKWQDGKPITCEDVKYGASRTFAQDVITNGPNYIINFLDIPANADGSSKYAGPYKKTGQDLFDKAVTCSGNTITYHFKKPWNDFNFATASLLAFSPFRADKDQGDKSNLAIFSDGPYQLQGTFDKDKGGTFVRNPNWDPATDPVRKAYPDQITYNEGVQTEVAYQRAIADSGADKTMIPQIQAPPSVLPQIVGNPSAKNRSVTVQSPYIDYVQPNMKSKVFSNEKVREAFAVATNRDAYVTAYGGPQVESPSYAMCNPTQGCFKQFNTFGTPTAGDPAKAKQMLQAAGVTTPVKITVVYRSRPTADKALSALKASWDQAGFDVQLEGLTTKYYQTISGPAYADRDAFWAGWGADWPSGSTVLPPLFDGRINISAGGSNQDYGYFNDPAVNAQIDAAYKITDQGTREKAWGDVDEAIQKQAAVVPLATQKFTFMHGSGVKNFQTNTAFGGYADLANIAVK